MRKLEMDCIAVSKELRQVIRVAAAEKTVGNICSKVRMDLLRLHPGLNWPARHSLGDGGRR